MFCGIVGILEFQLFIAAGRHRHIDRINDREFVFCVFLFKIIHAHLRIYGRPGNDCDFDHETSSCSFMQTAACG